VWTTCAIRPAISLSRWREIEPASGQSGSTDNGAFVLNGMKDMPKMLKSSITIEVPNPGEILLEDFLKPLSMSQNALARAINVPPRRINEIVLGKRAITADTDLRLARYFKMSDGFFLRLQGQYDLRMRKRVLGKTLDAIRPRAA
jgi:antitoxin HigA-1